MQEPIAEVHSFILKVWVEQTAAHAGQVSWRGYITHVPGGERRYLQDLDDVVAFVRPYVQPAGAPLGPRQRLMRWLRRRTR